MQTFRLAIATAVLGVLIACAADDPSAPRPTAADATATADAPSERTRNVEIEVKDGEVVEGVQRVRINLGDEIVLVVRSDVADEVHVHGYDERADVKAGGAVRITFTADVPGVFIAELEERKTRLVELEVR